MVNVVKRRGHEEDFDEEKLYKSIYSACASAHMDEKECEDIADSISSKVSEMADSTEVLPAQDIRDTVNKELAEIDEELSFFYDMHLPDLKNL